MNGCCKDHDTVRIYDARKVGQLVAFDSSNPGTLRCCINLARCVGGTAGFAGVETDGTDSRDNLSRSKLGGAEPKC